MSANFEQSKIQLKWDNYILFYFWLDSHSPVLSPSILKAKNVCAMDRDKKANVRTVKKSFKFIPC